MLVGRALAKELKLPLVQPFTKVGRRSQHGRSVSERMNSVCFVQLKVEGDFLKGKKLLLLDDVYTTGTTLDQCAYLLRKAGADEVTAFSLARQMVQGFERKKKEAREEGEEVHPLLLHLFV